MKITIVAGARPNFMKIAPIIEAIELKKANGFNIDFRFFFLSKIENIFFGKLKFYTACQF